MRALSGPPVPEVRAARDAYVAGRDQHFYGFDQPAFIVEAAPDRQPPVLADLVALRTQPSKLLNASRQVIAFTGRTGELEALQAWRDGPQRQGAWLIHAAGGQGKTRLADRAAQQATAAGWTVGYARHRRDIPGGEPLIVTDERLLIVVDYAERWPQHDLHSLLRRYAGHTGPLRVLLLARSMSWWPAADAECDDLGIATREPLLLPPLAEDESGRRQLFDAACQRFAEIYQIADPVELTPAGRLSDPIYALTLGLHMAALAAVDAYAGSGDPPSSSADLSRYLLNRERRYWLQLHGEQHQQAAARSVFVATLTGPLPHADGTALLEHTGLPHAAGTSAQQLLDAHARCYPPTAPDTVLEPLYPDRLAEDFIALTLPERQPTGHTDTWAAHLITTARQDGERLGYRPGPLFARDTHRRLAAHTSRALIVLAAAATRHEHVAERLRILLAADPGLAVDTGGAALLAVTPHLDAALARSISDHLPDEHVDLAPAAAALTERLTCLTAATAAPEDRARDLSELALRLSRAGRRDEAVAPAEQAVALYRQLADADPRTYLPNLAASLHNLGKFLTDRGRRDDGLAQIVKAVALYRRLVDIDPAALPLLAMSLNSAGVALAELGRDQEAVAPTVEAVAIQRRLIDADPSAGLSGLAQSLANLGIRLSHQGHKPDALEATREAVELYRRLVDINPAAHLPGLANSLNGLGTRLSELGRQEEALDPATEAVELYRRLVDTNLAAHLPDLAWSLNTLGNRLSALGRQEEALGPTTEAVELYRRLVDVNPAAHLPDLASALTNLGATLTEVGEHARALRSTEEAVAAYRRLAESRPAAHLSSLAVSLSNRGVLLAELGQHSQAMEPTSEALEIRRGLAESNPGAYLPDLAASLHNAGGRLSELGRHRQALDHVEQAAAIYQRLAETNPDAYHPGLADCLESYARICVTGRRNLPKALDYIQKAVALRQQLAGRLPQVFGAQLWWAYYTLADVLDTAGQAEAATELRRRLNQLGKGADARQHTSG